MKTRKRLLSIIMCGLMLANLLCGCSSAAGGTEASSETSVTEDTESAEESKDAGADPTAAASAVFTEDGAEVSGSGLSYSDGVLTVSAAGTYSISGTTADGRILVDAEDCEVTLLLEGADITCADDAAIFVSDAKSVTIRLAEGTENRLADGGSYSYEGAHESAEDEEPNACVYSKDDLIIEGAGSLTVTASYANGITSKDTLVIESASVTVDARKNGINGKDSLTLTGAALTVTAGEDALRSTNDSDESLGWVTVEDSTLTLTSGEDGIQAETLLTMRGGSCSIVSGGGSGATLAEDTSAKGLKGLTGVVIESGTFTLDCADDAIHSNGDVTITGGEFTISTADDAVHADNAADVGGGTFDILTCYEGLEGLTVNVSGGEISIVSSDDGINAAGGNDGSGFGAGFNPGSTDSGGFDPNNSDMTPPDGTDGTPPELPDGETPTAPGGEDGNPPAKPDGEAGGSTDGSTDSTDSAESADSADNGGFSPGGGSFDSFGADEGACITISGGVIYISAGGDGIDSNGDLVVSGGETYVLSTGNGDGAIDYESNATITGGTVIAAGGAAMAMNFGSDSTQGSILVSLNGEGGGFGGGQSGEISLTDADGNTLASWTPDGSYSSVVVSCAGIEDGGRYTLTAGGGTQDITMDGLIYGSGTGDFGGMGGMGGGRGGQGDPGANGQGGGRPGGDGGDPNAGGTDPNARSGGQSANGGTENA